MISFKKSLYTAALVVGIQSTSFSQATQANIDPDADFKLAKEFFQKEQFSLAYPLFKNISLLASPNSKLPISVQVESRYYSLVCGLMLNESASEVAAREFIDLEHNTPRIQMLSYHLGEYYYRNQQFVEALNYYEKAGIDNLNNRQIAEMKFHQAYGYFTLQRFSEAKPLFDAIRQIPTDPNYLDANYYFGFISFYDKQYNVALESFRKVENEPTYANIVPYYITEILYFSGQKDKAIEYGEAKLAAGGQYYDTQLKQLVGHAYFEKKNYTKALPYLEEYVDKADKVRREDLYELAYTQYETKQYTKAIAGFKELGGKEDSLAQNSMYLLADAYLKTGQKANARNAFLFSAANNSNASQRQIARFHYAKLSFELGFQDIALNELQSFINEYPNSTYIPEAKELLVSVLANTNNYKDALTLYESLKGKSETVKRVYPKILYGRAVELVNDQQMNQADAMLNELIAQPYNNAQLPYVYFWKGEIALRQNNPDAAIEFFNNYLKNPATNGEVNVTNARYNLGHAYFKKEQYRQALGFFEQVTRSITPASTAVEQDAFLRSADAQFMNRNYSQAASMYDVVLNNNMPSADYALYQRAIIAGASNRSTEKINQLQALEQRFPSSALIPDANLEVANTYLADENYRAAIAPLTKLVRNRNAASLHPQGYLKLGVAHFNLENNQDALTNFQTLISTYPNSAESDAAVEYVRNIFVDQQKPAEFVNFMRQNGKNISFSEEDSLTYASANIRYQNRDMTNALTGLKDYLNRFPNGRYAIDANYVIADIYNSRKEYENALIGYTYVASKAPNKYAERAVLQAARLNFFEIKNYVLAEQYFTQLKELATDPAIRLESMRGLLRSQYRLNRWKEAVPNAQDLLTQKGIATDDRMMANMVIAKNQHLNNQLSEATATFRTVVNLGKSEFAAEARYQLAAILYTQNNLSAAEKAAFEVINKAGSYEYWTTKAYILLGDIYWKQGDFFNSEATLKSVAENATIPELKEEAQVKLDAVIDEKNRNSKVQQ
ncbi:tetratricopeptide repeat protein [Aridibaculum aurantiacum]|uniref:tetratricopeptide repeat protein n=1 Tax=Aridibaculum aurantiacum TaxID=2810307 RepID=UPI001F60A34F|nr:tetratricopeptide repeat protein [Aridibaculum aurantiacum]